MPSGHSQSDLNAPSICWLLPGSLSGCTCLQYSLRCPAKMLACGHRHSSFASSPHYPIRVLLQMEPCRRTLTGNLPSSPCQCVHTCIQKHRCPTGSHTHRAPLLLHPRAHVWVSSTTLLVCIHPHSSHPTAALVHSCLQLPLWYTLIQDVC